MLLILSLALSCFSLPQEQILDSDLEWFNQLYDNFEMNLDDSIINVTDSRPVDDPNPVAIPGINITASGFCWRKTKWRGIHGTCPEGYNSVGPICWCSMINLKVKMFHSS
jgi:hypothetical protein